MASLMKCGVFFVLLVSGVLGRFLPEEIFQNTSNRNSNGERQEDCNCEWRFFQHYEAKGCQIVQMDSCGCPTNYLCSPVKQSASQSKVCLYQSVAYKVGEKIKLSDSCQVCRCVDGITPQVVCRQRECPQLDLVEGENCHLVYEENKCCPSRYECIGNVPENASETSAFTCVYNNLSYPLGAKIYPSDDPCLVCECKEDWNGVDNSSCYQQECVFEKKKHLLDAGCIPIYHERRCCPIEYYCPEDLHYNNLELRELEGENSTENGGSCIFGDNSYEIGAELSLNNSCVKCTCQVPPDFTCVHQSCSLPPSAENCVEIRSAGQCCPTYDCLLGDEAVTETSATEEGDSEPSTTEEGACPTPLCADDSCQIEIPPGHECPTCVCGGITESREKNDFEPMESPFDHGEYMENSNGTENAKDGNRTLSSRDDSENELLSNIYVEKLAQQNSNSENLEDIEPPMRNSETELQTEENPETEEYFIQFKQPDTEDAENHLSPSELRQKRSENMLSDETQAQPSQQQWHVLQQDEDEMETGETIEREREFSEESNERFDEIKPLGIKGHNTSPAETVELEDTDFDNVLWTTIVPGCPTPLCADSSCRIGIPQGHRCPTCICKKLAVPNKSFGCFHGSSTVTTRKGPKKILDLQVGDEVASGFHENGQIFYSPIIAFLHKDQDMQTVFIRLETDSGNILFLTSTHLLFRQMNHSIEATFAFLLEEGDLLYTASKMDNVTLTFVTSVTVVTMKGVYAPLTDSGTVLVNGVWVSCYAEIASHDVAHAALFPLRLIHVITSFAINFYRNSCDSWKYFSCVSSGHVNIDGSFTHEGGIQEGIHWYPRILCWIFGSSYFLKM